MSASWVSLLLKWIYGLWRFILQNKKVIDRTVWASVQQLLGHCLTSALMGIIIVVDLRIMDISGFPTSGRIREKKFWSIRESQRILLRVRESQGILLWLRWTKFQSCFKINAPFSQSWSLPGIFHLAALAILRSNMCLKVREKPHGKVRDLFQSWLLGTLRFILAKEKKLLTAQGFHTVATRPLGHCLMSVLVDIIVADLWIMDI